MCVIMYKPKGVKVPDVETIKACFESNPHGAGIMFPTKDGVQTIKGLMTRGALMSALAMFDYTDVPLVVHFRISTGGSGPTMTHPFPITDDAKKLGAKLALSDVALVHNGIIPLTQRAWDTADRNTSDTFRFVRDYAADLILGTRWYRNARTVRLLANLAESKLAVMSKDGHVELIGRFEEFEGCYYSNGTYKPSTYTYPRFADDDDWMTVPDEALFDVDDYGVALDD